MKDTITYDDFVKLDIRAGNITAAEAIPKSKKLLKLTVSFGPEVGTRTILAGIAETFQPDELINCSVLAVINLAPRMMMGIESHGMLLAGHTANGSLSLARCNGVDDGGEIG